MTVKSTAKGFTLIEVVLGMTLLSIMVVLLFSAMRTSAQSWHAGEGKIAYVNESAIVYNFFQRHLTSTLPLWEHDSGDGSSLNLRNINSRNLSFQGTRNSMQFVSNFPASALRPGTQLFQIELIKNRNQEYSLQVTITPFFPSLDGIDWEPEQEILLRDVEKFSLAYYGVDQDNASEGWFEEWTDRKNLPNLVKITIARSNEIYWPDMIVPIKSAVFVSDQTNDQGALFE